MSEENQPTPSTSAAARKKEEKARKKDQRSWENIMKSMGDIPDSERMVILKEKYTSLYNDLRRTSSNYQHLEKKFITLQRDRDLSQSELNKNILAKAKLESLCRELQKQNRAIKDENITRVKEEEEKRREVATNFTERLNSLCSMMDENKDKSVRLREENMNMTVKLTELYNKFQERETHLADVNRQLDTQKELFESKIKKMELEYKADRKAWEEESKNLISDLLKSSETNRLLEENIRSMQANLDIYKNQYSDFEQTMSRSNEVFKTFHGEINKLQKSNTTLEKEKGEYITKWQSCHNSVVEISEKNQQLAKKLELTERKVATLEKLCRQLQTERTTLHKQLHDKTELLGAPLQKETPQMPNPKTISQLTVQRKDFNNDLQKVSISRKSQVAGDHLMPPAEGEEDIDLVDLLQSEADYLNDPNQMVNPHYLFPEPLPAQMPEPQLMDYSDIELDAAGDGSIPQLEAQLEMPQSDSTETDDTDITATESSGGIVVKEAKSMPITKKEHDMVEDTFEEPQTSSVDLCGDLSLDALPLYKPAAVTDVPTQGGHPSLVRGSTARTNIRDVATQYECMDESTDETTPSDETGSSDTIALKESEAKTEIKKE